MPIRVTKRVDDDGTTYDADYIVALDGTPIGHVRRHDGTPTGYYGRWSAGRYYTDTRRDAINYLLNRHQERAEAEAEAEQDAHA